MRDRVYDDVIAGFELRPSFLPTVNYGARESRSRALFFQVACQGVSRCVR